MTQTEKAQIHAQMTIEQILSGFPQKSQKLAQAITKAGLHCVGCGAAVWETLEGGMLGHGFTEAQIEGLVTTLNAILDEVQDLNTISMTERAATKLKQILKTEGVENHGLRFGDQPGGCSGYEYVLDFEEAAGENDVSFESHGVPIYVDKSCVARLLGSEIDYIDGLHGAGFKISNPNVRSSCGCGTSQNY